MTLGHQWQAVERRKKDQLNC